ncbi:MAG: Flp pilus assembly protein CpaB, partial [Anaerolineae bacterium]|nr:Flp pilus assembly protein CpaB [Anaerolineae bacterium]
MRGGRALLLIGAVLILGALIAFLLMRPRPQPVPPSAEGTPMATPLPPDMVRIVVSVQNIPRGMVITEDSLAISEQNWPKDSVPSGAIYTVEAVYGRKARVEIPNGMPILESMLTEVSGAPAAFGSDMTIMLPEGMVAYAMPVGRYSSLAWGLRPGDRVDVIISLLLVELDQEFQSMLPNQMACVNPPEGEECKGGPEGRLEVLPNGWLVSKTASEPQRPQLVTQLTIQNALVLQVGDWPKPEGTPVPEGEAAPTPEPRAEEAAAAPAEPEVEPITLAVTPQEALILEYLQAVGARINLVARSVADAQKNTRFSIETVTLEYVMNAYRIGYPNKLPYGVTPPLTQLERVARSESAAQYKA